MIIPPKIPRGGFSPLVAQTFESAVSRVFQPAGRFGCPGALLSSYAQPTGKSAIRQVGKPAPLKTFHRRRAFTLVEILIAVVIFSMVLAAINGIFYGALRLRTKTSRMIEESLSNRQTVAIIRRDLQGIMAPNGVLSGSLKSGAASTDMELQGAAELYTCTGDLAETVPWGDVQKVTYLLRNPANPRAATGKDLVRMTTRNLLTTMQDLPAEQFLMGGVQQIQFYFYDGFQWRNTWDSTTETSGLPKAIKVQIDLGAERGDRGEQRTKPPIQLLVPVVVQSRTNQNQSASDGQ